MVSHSHCVGTSGRVLVWPCIGWWFAVVVAVADADQASVHVVE